MDGITFEGMTAARLVEFSDGLDRAVESARQSPAVLNARATASERQMKSELDKLRDFYKAVAELTSNHSTVGDSAVVFPVDLAEELVKINPEWWKLDTEEWKRQEDGDVKAEWVRDEYDDN